jgi:ketosteroid isomerase-like protein
MDAANGGRRPRSLEEVSMMREAKIASVLIVGALLLLPAVAGAGVEEDIIALAKSQWAADMAKDPAKMMATVADDYTEFNSDYPTRIDGKALNAKFAEAAVKNPGSVVVAEMANPKVQVYGDVAILTYNYLGMNRDKDGVTHANAAKSTRVYAKIGGTWKLVHANFAPMSGDDD